MIITLYDNKNIATLKAHFIICNYNVREELNADADTLMLDLFLNAYFYTKISRSKIRYTLLSRIIANRIKWIL